jgi:CDP-diacylglycerol--glycerol-3-phosphate 3-phosphatidyltransferase
MAGGSACLGRCPLGVVEASGHFIHLRLTSRLILRTGGRQHDHRCQGMADQRAGWHRPRRRGIIPARLNGSFGSRHCVYLAIGCGDFLDGLVARLTRTESLLGKRLDTSMDALGLLIASAAAVFLNRLPLAFLLVGLSYYLFQLGLTYRRFRGKFVRSLKDRPFGRAVAGIHMGFVGLALIPTLSATLLKHAAMLFMLPLLLGFVWDWLVVSGRLGDEADDRWGLLFIQSGSIAAGVARLVILLAGIPAWQAVFAARPIRCSCLGCIMVHDGVRVAGSISGHSSGSDHPQCSRCLRTPTALQLLVFDCMVVLIITGTGRWSLWRPEERLVFQ